MAEGPPGVCLSHAANCMGGGKLEDPWGSFSVLVPLFDSWDQRRFWVSSSLSAVHRRELNPGLEKLKKHHTKTKASQL